MQVYLRTVRKGQAFRIAALCDSPNECQLFLFMTQLKEDRPAELDKLLARIQMTAVAGPPRNKQQCRPIKGFKDLFELKTSGGIRVLFFYDEGHLIICTHGSFKAKEREFRKECRCAQEWMNAYFFAKRRQELIWLDLKPNSTCKGITI